MRSLRIVITAMSIFALLSAAETTQAGPFADLFKAIRRSITQPPPRHHTSSSGRPSKKTSSDASSKRTPSKDVHEPPNSNNVRSAQASSGKKAGTTDLPYGIPVPGKDGFVTSPFAPSSGYVDVRGYPPGTEVKDPYSGKSFLIP